MLPLKLASQWCPLLQRQSLGQLYRSGICRSQLGSRYIHSSNPTYRIRIFSRTPTEDGQTVTTQVTGEAPLPGSAPTPPPPPGGVAPAATDGSKFREHGLGYDDYRSPRNRNTKFHEKQQRVVEEVDEEVRDRVRDNYAIARAERLAGREAQLAAAEEMGELEEEAEDGFEMFEEAISSKDALLQDRQAPVQRPVGSTRDIYHSADALSNLRKEFPLTPAEVALGKPGAPIESREKPEKLLTMPKFGGKSFPNLDLTRLPWNPDEVATWVVKYGTNVEQPLSNQMTLQTSLKVLAHRSPYNDRFVKAPSIYHLMTLLMKLEKDRPLESNYISFLNALFTNTRYGQHRFVVDMLFEEPKLTRKHSPTERQQTLQAMFARIVQVIGVHRVYRLSDTGAAVCMGALHLLGGQRLWTPKDMGLHAQRVNKMNLDSSLVFADALSRVPSWQQGSRHKALLRATLRHIASLVGFHQQPRQSEVFENPVQTRSKPTAANFKNEHLVAYLQVLAKSLMYPRDGWPYLMRHLRGSLWSHSQVEVGILATCISFLCLPTDDKFLNAFALRIEDDVAFFPLTSRIEAIHLMLDRGKRCNASVANLLQEVHHVNDHFIRTHPYMAAKLYDVLMLLWYTDRPRFEDNKQLRVVFIREHLLRCKEVLRSSYYAPPDLLADADVVASDDQAPFESLLLPLLTPLQCTAPPADVKSMPTTVSEQQEADIRLAQKDAASVLYHCVVNGVYVSAALLCDDDGNLVPWSTVEHVLAPRPAWWRNKFRLSHVQDGEIISESTLQLDDDDFFDEDLLSLDGKDADGRVKSRSSGQLGDGLGKRKVLAKVDSSQDNEMLASEESNALLDAKRRKKMKKLGRQRRYITLDKYKLESAGLTVRPIAITVYDDDMALLKPHSARIFNGFVAAQSNILYQSGWASISMLASELSPDLSTKQRQAVLYQSISTLVNVPPRGDLSHASDALSDAGEEYEDDEEEH
ncbi:uncharacterized protein LOC135805323 [Sycon ciliatum]|uniref:uncharacterized protein LOC135805323 n=1 Tax=Sycon ciliatum TaxID=27933 RepID=UPI0031F6380B